MILGNLSDPKLKEFNEDWENDKKAADEKQRFLDSHVKELNAFVDKMHSRYWDRISERLRELGNLPADYTEEKYVIEFSDESKNFILTDMSAFQRNQIAKKLMDVLPDGMLDAFLDRQKDDKHAVIIKGVKKAKKKEDDEK